MALRHRLIGRAARIYWRIRRPRTLGVRALVHDGTGRIALVRHTYTESWYLPGGGVKKGESFADAALREIEEEIGLSDCAIERILGVYHSQREYKDDHIVLFVIQARDPDALSAPDEMEIAEARWFARDALPPTLSAATARRIGEYHAGTIGAGPW